TNPAYSGLFISAGRMSGVNMSLGGGIGIDSYGVNDGLLSIPLFAEARWLPLARQRRWFLSGRLGYSFFKGTDPVVNEARGGLMLHPSTGFIWRAGKRLGITTEVGYRFQWAADERQLRFRDGVQNRKVNYRRLAFSLGLLF
ncbi:MAG: hypothetical protein R3350_09430, partial [Saprospiraceae bacterium]|nr:hypothetical protein [Saprospiraceae bacterium]